jgi:hypothetical protein
MGLTMKGRKELAEVTASRYRKAGKKEKKVILDEFVQATGLTRWYSSWVLRNHGKLVRVTPGLKLVGDVTRKIKKHRDRLYDEAVVEVLKKVWAIMDLICGKRLAPALKEVVPVLEREGEIRLDSKTRTKLLSISPATIDRLLAPERKKMQLKGRSGTKPGTLLKHQIPIRTFSQWDEKIPGFAELDLVGHDGGHSYGDYCQTLDLTDVCTCWTEMEGVLNKAQIWVFGALVNIRNRMPFDLLGIDSDNGSEFINHHLVNYCKKERITFTRGRPYKKNDNCYVEQKNFSVVRRAIGYCRYETEEELRILNKLYANLRLYINYFQPVMKLQSKERIGSKVKKHYDQPLTPYKRVLQSPSVSDASKRRLGKEYAQLNPAQLKREMDALHKKLMQLANRRERRYGRMPH